MPSNQQARSAAGTDTTAPRDGEEGHLWRSPLLSGARELELEQGRLQYFGKGAGPVIVLVHGWGVNANLWRRVFDTLSRDHCCYALDLPFGSHRVPLEADADLSPDGCGRLLNDVLEALDLENVTLVGNDSGGAYSQIALSQRSGRVARLVLNACETPYDEFPPPPFAGLQAAARDPALLRQACASIQEPAARTRRSAYGLLAKHPLERLVSDSYALPPSRSEGVLRDFAKVVSSARSAPVHAAGKALMDRFDKPVLLAWASEDPVFPLANARRYAAALPNGRVEEVADSYSFVAEDQPAWLAERIAAFTCVT